jgi:aspartyl-tRNA(Asn)/glutamyl-tRNA(Gln) amidotransferase subunit C
MKRISQDDVARLATLSALEFSPEELVDYTEKLNEALAVINKIRDVNTDAIPKYSTTVDISELREDEPHHSMLREVALQNAPKQRKGCFNVPKVVD